MASEIIYKLRAIIRQRGLKQRVVAERAGMTDKELSDLLRGRRTFRAEYIAPICKALDITPNDLLNFKGE